MVPITEIFETGGLSWLLTVYSSGYDENATLPWHVSGVAATVPHQLAFSCTGYHRSKDGIAAAREMARRMTDAFRDT